MIITEEANIKILEILKEHKAEGIRVFFAGFG